MHSHLFLEDSIYNIDDGGYCLSHQLFPLAWVHLSVTPQTRGLANIRNFSHTYGGQVQIQSPAWSDVVTTLFPLHSQASPLGPHRAQEARDHQGVFLQEHSSHSCGLHPHGPITSQSPAPPDTITVHISLQHMHFHWRTGTNIQFLADPKSVFNTNIV